MISCIASSELSLSLKSLFCYSEKILKKRLPIEAQVDPKSLPAS